MFKAFIFLFIEIPVQSGIPRATVVSCKTVKYNPRKMNKVDFIYLLKIASK